MFCILKKKMYPDCVSKHKLNREKQVSPLMFSSWEKGEWLTTLATQVKSEGCKGKSDGQGLSLKLQ